MEKDYIKQLIFESATKVCQALNALQAIERQFNDNLVDDNGMIYFAYLNGTVKRYKRNEFLKMAKEKDF